MNNQNVIDKLQEVLNDEELGGIERISAVMQTYTFAMPMTADPAALSEFYVAWAATYADPDSTTSALGKVSDETLIKQVSRLVDVKINFIKFAMQPSHILTAQDIVEAANSLAQYSDMHALFFGIQDMLGVVNLKTHFDQLDGVLESIGTLDMIMGLNAITQLYQTVAFNLPSAFSSKAEFSVEEKICGTLMQSLLRKYAEDIKIIYIDTPVNEPV